MGLTQVAAMARVLSSLRAPKNSATYKSQTVRSVQNSKLTESTSPAATLTQAVQRLWAHFNNSAWIFAMASNGPNERNSNATFD